ncbi:MAG: bifunctional diaminohydroxyphosphoribosylaminopyrimidine deaminase/5-amino-6-(5-phosphoribosylamino)uracil reductase RibD [Vibrionaceae bacterium]
MNHLSCTPSVSPVSAKDVDEFWMKQALELAKKGIYSTTPNPRVGCVLIKDGQLVGHGFHFRAGEPHAEVHALQMAGSKAQGACAYITLEPCSHFGRTPPCADALIAAGIVRVVCATVDPNPNVAGRGIARLQNAQIEVKVGVCENEAKALNAGFLKRMQHGLPFVQLKLACSLDGRTALANGQSKWITGVSARADVQVFRAQACAILSTSATVLADDPQLNVRFAQLPEPVQAEYRALMGQTVRQPLKVLLDSQGRIPESAAVFASGKTLVITAQEQAPFSRENVEFIYIDPQKESNVLKATLRILAARGINWLWVEAGAKLAASLLQAKLVDELIVYQAPKLMGADSHALVALTGLSQMDSLPAFTFTQATQVGCDLRLRLRAQAESKLG